jgi:hypothetical protein
MMEVQASCPKGLGFCRMALRAQSDGSIAVTHGSREAYSRTSKLGTKRGVGIIYKENRRIGRLRVESEECDLDGYCK